MRGKSPQSRGFCSSASRAQTHPHGWSWAPVTTVVLGGKSGPLVFQDFLAHRARVMNGFIQEHFIMQQRWVDTAKPFLASECT